MDDSVIRPVKLLFMIVLVGAVADRIVYDPGPTRGTIPVIQDHSISVNLHTLEDLQILPGIGPVIAGRIVQQRLVHPFQSAQDFETRIRGIGPTFMLNYGQWLTFEQNSNFSIVSSPLNSIQPDGLP
jgi:Helix-hairpin-helix motif